MEDNKKMPGYTGYKPQFADDNLDNAGGLRDNRFYIPGYSGYVPSIKAENAFGESYGKTTGASVRGDIKQGYHYETSPDEKFMSMNQAKYTNMAEQSRVMRPAEVFEPGYDSVYYKQTIKDNGFKGMTEK